MAKGGQKGEKKDFEEYEIPSQQEVTYCLISFFGNKNCRPILLDHNVTVHQVTVHHQ